MASNDIFSIKSAREFEYCALETFRYQIQNCDVYSDFVSNLNYKVGLIKTCNQIPFLPIEFFKTHPVVSENTTPEIVFTSSGTTGSLQSKHPVTDIKIYKESFQKGLKFFYGDIKNYAVLALLPSYQEREGSSLIYMVDELISQSTIAESGYFLYNYAELAETLKHLKETKTHTLLIGVTHALLDFAESHTIEFPELIVMETGGMKGKRREMIREELHEILCEGFGVPLIHSEYGMTELLSQAYSKGAGKFNCPPWMKIMIRDTNDPLNLLEPGKTGGINVIDLANINSCSFIATQDLGRLYADESFEILGRFDNSDIRGCNLLVD
ncbi:MAG: acyl transferase [Flavobacterium sp.]|nr:acyl transferase [Pedobacter sp.]